MSDPIDLVVVGGGPGGYTAAFRAADLGLRTVIVDDRAALGGVCLNVGCIPSKALLHAAAIVNEAGAAEAMGIRFGPPAIDLQHLRAFTDGVVRKMADGLSGLARRRKVEVICATATFDGPTRLRVSGDAERTLEFRTAIIAVGSRPAGLAGFPDDERIVDSSGALALVDVPEHLVVVGGGIIGLEMATVYRALGAEVTIVELMDQLIPGCDADLVAPLARRLAHSGVTVHLSSRVDEVLPAPDGVALRVTGDGASLDVRADRVLLAVGRRPNGDRIGAESAGVRVDERGFIEVDRSMRTNVAHIFAIGDVVGEPMLAHKASHQGRVAAENAAGRATVFDARTIPAVAYTDPEVAWVGLTETGAAGRDYEVAAIPWAASGRAHTLGRPEGRTKLLIDPGSRRVLGAGIVGPGAGELISEFGLAVEMGAVADDIALTVHPHPTLSETGAMAAEWAERTITDLYRPPAVA